MAPDEYVASLPGKDWLNRKGVSLSACRLVFLACGASLRPGGQPAPLTCDEIAIGLFAIHEIPF